LSTKPTMTDKTLPTKKFDFIKGYTFGFCTPKGGFKQPIAKESLLLMKERTGCTHVIFALSALQQTAQSIYVDYVGEHMVDDDELISMITYAKTIGLTPILKPLVNVSNGTWRAHINFFDYDVPCEPKWSDWFKSYTDYQLHYAKIAEQTGCSMLIVGCEMVQTERRDAQWRQLITEVRKHYHGLISYNTDKYQEDHITWWDAVDVISSSGYYPIDDWDKQLIRIQHVVEKFNKPFFFAEAGCMSTDGSQFIPNDWSLSGNLSEQVQADYYRTFFTKTLTQPWIRGYGLWDWSSHLYPIDNAKLDTGYAVYGKAAEQVIFDFFSQQ